MAIPKIDEQNIMAAIKYIDEHGIPDKDKSTQYVLVTEEGKQYPSKYVVAVANYLANGVDIVTDGYNAVEAKIILRQEVITLNPSRKNLN